LFKTSKTLKILVFTLLTAALLMTVISSSVPSVKAQGTDTVVVFASVGGTTDPIAGTYSYADGSTQTFTATAGDGFILQNWEVATAAGAYSTTDNPLVLTLNESGYAIQANFAPIIFMGPINVTLNTSTDAIVVVVGGVGGTVSPAPGTYALANATSLNLTATPDSGWTFNHWVIAGTPLSHGAYAFTDTPTNTPYNVNHGYGNTYSYQPVFSPISTSTSPTPKVNEFSTASAIIIAAILVIVAFGTYAYTRRAKK
jgi:hypothetical protein